MFFLKTLLVLAPITFVLYCFIMYFIWRSREESIGKSFARHYWYTNANPLHRSWWTLFFVIFYFVLIFVAALVEG
jgi:heme/copper-type cytochrome/quinol oxidase subunit 2